MMVGALAVFAEPALQPPGSIFAFDEYLLVPLRVHLLTAREQRAIETTLTETDIRRILTKVNGIWSQAGLHFYLESLVREEAANQETDTLPLTFRDRSEFLKLRPAISQAEQMFHVYYLKEMGHNGIFFAEGIFVKDTASLREVEGGIEEPLPRVTSHELGHAFGLTHRQERTNLMASGTTGIWLNKDEIEKARLTATTLEWIDPAPRLLKRADDLYQQKKWKEAASLYGRLANIPVKADQVKVAQQRAKE